MSTIPSRSRSLRKPNLAAEQTQSGTSTDPASANATKRPGTSSNPSPSKLKQPSNYGLARQDPDSRPKTSNGPSRPSTRSIITRPPLTSDNKRPATRSGARTPTDASTTVSRPPTTSRPPLTSDNKRPSTRTGAKTPTETAAANTGLQRRPSTRHSKTASSTAFTTTTFNDSTSTSNSTHSTHPTHPSAPILRPPSSQHSSSTLQSNRPSFTTHLQHYSPAKSLAPKPATSTFLAPPTPSKHPANIALSAETSRLQAELLQLHLLHHSAASTTSQWRSSAKQTLGKRFEDVKTRHVELIQAESDEGEKSLGEALNAWAGNGASIAGVEAWGLEDKVIWLDEVVTGVWSLNEGGNGGRYGKVIRKFERWVNGVESLWESRNTTETGKLNHSSVNGRPALFVEPLDMMWTDEVLALTRKLRGWKERLQSLILPSSSNSDAANNGKSTSVAKNMSSLERTIFGFTQLVDGMLSELGVMLKLQREVMERDTVWIKAMAMKDDEEDSNEQPVGAIWRQVPMPVAV